MKRRNTIQKDLVINAVVTLRRHVTADEIYEFIRSEYPNIGKGTVYRNLGVLEEEGSVRRVEVPDGPDRFDYILDNHYHCKCVKCGNVFDVDMDEVSNLTDMIKDSHGVQFLSYDIFFKGICCNCSI